MKNLFHFLFDESQREALDDSLVEDIEGVWEDMAKAEDIETKKKGLADVLKELGVDFEKSSKADGTGFEEDASSMLFVTPDAQLFRRAREIVQRPENMHTLVKAGWVGVPVGQDNTKEDGDARYVLRFLDVGDAEVKPESSNDPVDLEKLIKKAREYGDGTQSTEKVKALTQPMQAKAKEEESLHRAADELLTEPINEEGTRVSEGRRCWKGFEATPGKKPFAKGSCRKKK